MAHENELALHAGDSGRDGRHGHALLVRRHGHCPDRTPAMPAAHVDRRCQMHTAGSHFASSITLKSHLLTILSQSIVQFNKIVDRERRLKDDSLRSEAGFCALQGVTRGGGLLT